MEEFRTKSVKISELKLLKMEGIVSMDSIIMFICMLFQAKDPKETETTKYDPAYNDFVNLLIFILGFFCIIIAILWVVSKFVTL